jgi:hypothetical protein
MDDRERSFEEKLVYRRAASRFESAFEACEQLSQDDRQLLLKEIAVRILQQLPMAPSDERTAPKVVGIEIKQT